MAKKYKPYIPKSKNKTEGNQFLDKELFKELPQISPTEYSQLYVFRREQRGDGVVFLPVRATFEQLMAVYESISRDEGNSLTTYLPYEIFDEGDSTATPSADEQFDEGNS